MTCDFDLYDSCADPTNETLNAIWPDRRAMWSIVFARDDLLGALAARVEGTRHAPPPGSVVAW